VGPELSAVLERRRQQVRGYDDDGAGDHGNAGTASNPVFLLDPAAPTWLVHAMIGQLVKVRLP
jgi:hypothetical protein